jgi:hemoglobin
MLAILFFLQAATAPVPPGEMPVEPYAQSNANAGATPFEGQGVWRAFHGQAGVDRVVDGLVARNTADPRIADIFRGQDLARLRRVLKEQFCYILNGGCTYSGRDMRTTHKDIGVQRKDMNALVENLEKSMSAEHIPYAAQSRFLAKLAGMERQVVVR